jgi:beta-lactamase superfamily II metal-dependent hydrolase
MATKFIGNDCAKVYEKSKGRGTLDVLYWGDEVDVTGTADGRTRIKFRTHDKVGGAEKVVTAFLGKDVFFTDERPLRVRLVDVGQGDGALVETPKGKKLLVDGGEEGHMGRYLRAAFRERPLAIDTIVVSHGDADHFAGLTDLLAGGPTTVTVERVVHNGLAKRPKKKNGKDRPEEEMFGATASKAGALHCVELVDDVRGMPDADLNLPFQAWRDAMAKTKTKAGKKTPMSRLAAGGTLDPFADEGVRFEVLGPIATTIGGKPALALLHEEPGSSSISASHTVNGHSVVLRLVYGNVRILFAADLNEESEDLLLAANADLRAEVLKVPHHGSADFSPAMLRAVSPIVSVVSSGDESVAKDYIHPRAGLVGALGRASRTDVPLVFVTEMVAFFENLTSSEIAVAKNAGLRQPFRLGRKRQFGIVHVRTDGKRLVVLVPGAKEDSVEAHAFHVDASHDAKPVALRDA